ncbi:MAG: hypothetical protein RMI91_01200 [Gemmatales bacterium]|nr:hypothetical protein [Gemmatales bacterium]MDW7993249.1 hypothetical protein [Gemmatales bacterium]
MSPSSSGGEGSFTDGLRPRRAATEAKPQANDTNRVSGRSSSRAITEPIAARLQRRLEVCDRIKLLALETGDARLEEEACKVEDLIWRWYLQEQQRVSSPTRGALPGSARTRDTGHRASSDPSRGGPERPVPRSATNSEPLQKSREMETKPLIPAHERLDRLDVHTIRGSASEVSVPVVELSPEVGQTSRQEQEK